MSQKYPTGATNIATMKQHDVFNVLYLMKKQRRVNKMKKLIIVMLALLLTSGVVFAQTQTQKQTGPKGPVRTSQQGTIK